MSWKCHWKKLPVKKIHLEQILWINIMPVKGNFDCRRKRVPAHSLDITCLLNKSGWIRELEGASRRRYHKCQLSIIRWINTICPFSAYPDLLPLNLVYFVLEMSWKWYFLGCETAHLACHVPRSGRKTPIIIIIITLGRGSHGTARLLLATKWLTNISY